MSFADLIENIGKGVDAVGVAVIVIGAIAACLQGWAERHQKDEDWYRTYRRRLGRVILLGLELLVAADIIRTVAVRPTFTSAGVLAIIVGIRTFLSMSLEVELEGRWPWQGKLDPRPQP